MPHNIEKGNSGRVFLFIKRLTKIFLWGLLLFIVVSTVREMRNDKVVSKNLSKQASFKELK